MSRCDACLYSIGHDEGCPRSAYTEPSADYARGRADALREAMAAVAETIGESSLVGQVALRSLRKKLEKMR